LQVARFASVSPFNPTESNDFSLLLHVWAHNSSEQSNCNTLQLQKKKPLPKNFTTMMQLLAFAVQATVWLASNYTAATYQDLSTLAVPHSL